MDSKDSLAPMEASSGQGSALQAKRIAQSRTRWLRCGASLMILLVFAVSSARAARGAPRAKVKMTLGRALAILHDQQLPVDQRRRAMLQLADRNLDLARMAREALAIIGMN